MRQKEVLQKLSQEIIKLHNIQIKNNMLYRHGEHLEMHIGFPTSLIESIEDGIGVDIRFGFGVLSLSKKHPAGHLTLFDLKAMDRRIARERKKGR